MYSGPQELKIFSGNSNPQLAKDIAHEVKTSLGHCNVNRFMDGEIHVDIHDHVRGRDVFVIQSTCPPVNENAMELFVLMDALKRASASRITAVIPYYGYARQDRKASPRAPISAKLMADLLSTAGANRVMALDLHAAQIQGFFNIPFDHLFAIPTLAQHWRREGHACQNCVVVSPDAGGVDRVRIFAKQIDAPIAIIDKRRIQPNETKAYHLIGNVKDKTAILVDDMIDTAGTLTESVDCVLDNGASRVVAIATHGVLSGKAIERLEKSRIEQVWITDTIPQVTNIKSCSKLKVVPIAWVLAEAIKRINQNESISSLFQ